MGLWLSLKKDKVFINLYYKEEKIASIKVSDLNQYNKVMLDLDTTKDVVFKVAKINQDQLQESLGQALDQD